MLRTYLLVWIVLLAAVGLGVAQTYEGIEGLVGGDPGAVHHAQLARARREPFGERHVLLFGDSVAVVRDVRDPQDVAVHSLKDLLVVELNRLAPGMEVQSQVREGDYAPHFVARAQALRRWGRWYHSALLPVNMRSFNENSRLGGFAGHDFLALHLDLPEAWAQRRPGQVLEALFNFAWGRMDLALARGELSALLRSVAARLRGIRRFGLELAPPPGILEERRIQGLAIGDRVRRAYGGLQGAPPKDLRSLIAAGRALQDVGTRPLFYVTPLDQAALAAELPDQGRALGQAVENLKAALQAEGFEVLDASRRFQGGFFDPGTEHLAWAQRIGLARWLAQEALARPPLGPNKKSRP